MRNERVAGDDIKGVRPHDRSTPSFRYKGDDISERLLDVAASTLKLLMRMRRGIGTRNLIAQLERCAPSAGANYEEARGAQSRADFVHKVHIALKELRETRFWLRLIERAELVPSKDDIRPILHETAALIAILNASANTAKRG